MMKKTPVLSGSRIAEILKVSRETVRIDLIRLEKEGLLTRTPTGLEIVQEEENARKLVGRGFLSKEERRGEIVEVLAKDPELRNPDLAHLFQVSEGTIRNDLIALEKKGLLQRTHGGASLPEGRERSALVSLLVGNEVSPKTCHVCDRALSLLESGDVIYLDDSPFAIRMAMAIPPDKGVSIITNSLRAGILLSRRGYGSDVFILPGLLGRESLATEVRMGREIAEHFSVSKAFLGFPAYTQEKGFFVDSQAAYDTYALIARISDSLYILLDSSHSETRGRYPFPLEESLPRLREVLVDDLLTAETAARIFPASYPVTLCGENAVLKSPFNRQYIIGFASLYGSYEFSRTVRNSIEEAAKAHPNIELCIADNRMDAATTLRNIDAFIGKKVDLVIEYQHDFRLGPLIAEKLSHLSIPLIAVDIPIPGAVYFGANNYKAGLIAGEAAAEEILSRWNGRLDHLVVLTDTATGPLPENRIEGMLEVFLKRISFDRERIRRFDIANDPGEAERKAPEILGSFGPEDRTLIVSFNDMITLGILKGLQRAGRKEGTVVISYSYIESIARTLVQDDSPLIGSVAFFPERYGPQILELALRLLANESVNATNYVEHAWMGKPRGPVGKEG